MRTGLTARWAASLAIGSIALATAASPAAAKNPAAGSKQAKRMVAKQLEDRRFVGLRGDGAEVDWLFCAGGRHASRITSDGSTGVSEKARWRVLDAEVKRGGRWFEAVIGGPSEGGGTWDIAVGRHGRRFLAAVAWQPFTWGEVTRSPAGRACR